MLKIRLNLRKVVAIATCLAGMVVMSAFGQNPKREVIFTLNANEIVNANEYYLTQKQNQNKFAFILKDTLKNQWSFIFNGERIITTKFEFSNDRYFGDLYNPVYINPEEANGYVFCYIDDKNYYVNYKGIIDGPFDFATFNIPRLTLTSCYVLEKGYDYYYMLAGRWYGHKNGENKRINCVSCDGNKWYVYIDGNVSKGYEYVDDLKLTKSGQYAYVYTENVNFGVRMGSFSDANVNIKEKQFVNINGNVSNGYEQIHYSGGGVQLSENGEYAYGYRENGKWYVNINGRVSKGYEDIYIKLTERGKYMYSYKENEKWYVNINGLFSNGYEEIGLWNLTESGKYMYSYKENGKWYVNVNGNVSSSYEDVVYLDQTESGKYAYGYKENGKNYVNINGKISNGYEEIGFWQLQLTESGKYAYNYKENGKWYVNINGSISNGYEGVDEIKITEDGSYSYFCDFGEGMIYKNENGEIKETNVTKFPRLRDNFFNYNEEIDINSQDRKHSFSSTHSYKYAVIDGKRYGKSHVITAWYDRIKNAFIWYALESRELVVYEYNLD